MIDSVGRAHRRADCAVLGALALMAVSAVSAKEFSQYTYESNLLQNLPNSIEVTASQFALSRAHRAAEAECLAEVMYYEARGEGVDGEKAVAEVVMQRVKSLDYPKTVCGVVYDGVQPNRRDCQFTFACDGTLRRPRDKAAWSRVRVLAERIMTGDVKLSGITHNATAYHNVDVSPEWADGMLQTAQVGNHVFYKRDPSAQARWAQADAATPIDTVSGLFSETPVVPLDLAVTPERIAPQLQIPAVLRDGA